MTSLATQLIEQNPQVCATLLDGELVVMSEHDNVYYKINACGIKIWEFLQEQGRSLSDIVAFIAGCYNMPQDAVHADVHAFIVLMVQKNILQYSSHS